MKTIKLILSVLFLAGVVGFAIATARPAGPEAVAAEMCRETGCACAKVRQGAKGMTCAPPPAPAVELNLAAPFALVLDKEPGSSMSRRVSVSALVERALVDQRSMLRRKLVELERWDGRGQAVFAKWFGTNHEQARRLIHERVLRVLEVNNNYSFRNFRHANPPRPNVYAYVYASNPARVYVDQLFVSQVPAGENSRAGTITHEMSHFTIVGGTKDHAYGQVNCKALARTNPLLALTNADNFEYWAEGAR